MTDETRAVSFENEAGNSVETEEQPNEPSSENGSIDDGGENKGALQADMPESPLLKISDDRMEFAKQKGWDKLETADAIIDSYKELEQHNSTIDLSLKSDDPTEEEWADFRKRSGAPESSDKYELSPPEDMPDHVYYDDDLLSKSKEAAHKVGLKPQQFNEYNKIMQDHMIEQQVIFHQNRLEAMDTAGDAIRREWQSDVVMQDKLQTAFRSISASPGLKDAYIAAGILVEDPKTGKYTPTNADIVFYHAETGEKLMSEPGGFDGVAAHVSGQNPFKDGDHYNATHQGALITQDPELAKARIREAGKDPADWGFA